LKDGLSAIFPGEIEAQPLVHLVADAAAEQGRALDVLMEDLEVVRLEELGADVVDMRVRRANKALDVSGARAAGAGSLDLNGWRRKTEIRGGCHSCLAEDQG
jgi:hypothetical protein